MARQKKAPEFQCHIKYKNDLPLPPISPVLLDSSLTLPHPALTTLLKHDAVAYAPTSLEQGTKHFTLPAELLKYSVFNMVDLEGLNGLGLRQAAKGDSEDKDILTPIEELERTSDTRDTRDTRDISDNIVHAQAPSHSRNLHSQPANPTHSNVAKFSRPDVTWLRRTEYISSVKNNPNNVQVASVDDAKAFLANPVKFEEIVEVVEGGFEGVNVSVHPLKPKLELVQSFPIFFDSDSKTSYAHCLFLGDSSVTDQSILKLDPSAPIVNLFNPTALLNSDTLKSHGQFDIQKSTSESARSFVLMLPMDVDSGKAGASLAKISSTFSLRKRRAASGKGSSKVKKPEGILMKVARKA